MDYIAFFCALNHSAENESYLLDCLKSYDIGDYLIVRETAVNSHKLTNGQHYHFLVQMESADYARYRKRVFIDHFKLKGQAKKDMGRQYGKVNYLKDPDRMAIYMLKDNGTDDNVVSTTMTADQLESWRQQSYKKGEKELYKDKVEAYVVKKMWEDHHDEVLSIMGTEEHMLQCIEEKEILETLHHEIGRYYVSFVRHNHQCQESDNPYRGKKMPLTKAQIKNFQNYFILYNDIFKYVNDSIILSLIY